MRLLNILGILQSVLMKLTFSVRITNFQGGLGLKTKRAIARKSFHGQLNIFGCFRDILGMNILHKDPFVTKFELPRGNQVFGQNVFVLAGIYDSTLTRAPGPVDAKQRVTTNIQHHISL